MDMKIGEVREFKGKKYSIGMSNGCKGCYFEDKKCWNMSEEIENVLGDCDRLYREDKKMIIFVEVVE